MAQVLQRTRARIREAHGSEVGDRGAQGQVKRAKAMRTRQEAREQEDPEEAAESFAHARDLYRWFGRLLGKQGKPPPGTKGWKQELAQVEAQLRKD